MQTDAHLEPALVHGHLALQTKLRSRQASSAECSGRLNPSLDEISPYLQIAEEAARHCNAALVCHPPHVLGVQVHRAMAQLVQLLQGVAVHCLLQECEGFAEVGKPAK